LGLSSLLRVKGCNCLSEHPKPYKQREALISTHLWPDTAWRKEEPVQGRIEAAVCVSLRSSAFQHSGAQKLENGIRGKAKGKPLKSMEPGKGLQKERKVIYTPTK
jgi:hypothetical protein